MSGYEILDPTDFLTNGALFEEQFYRKVNDYDWERFRNKRVLIRGCASKMIPPWVYMFFVGKLADLSKLVYYGSEEDKIVVYPIKSSVRT